MSHADAETMIDRLYELQLLFWRNPKQRLRTSEIADELGVDERTVRRYFEILAHNGRLPLSRHGQLHMLSEDATIELPSLRLLDSEAVALFVGMRLLSQIHDERNKHITRTLTKIIAALPPALTEHQHKVVALARERQQEQPDRSDLFETLSQAWITQRALRLFYTPPHGATFECRFEPYWLEPSGIGRTIYILGRCLFPSAKGPERELFRTFKFERIESAQLLKHEPFTILTDFDGVDRLSKAWGVMYGEEIHTVRLRFSPYVEQRLKETVWHPTQDITDTPDGCILTLEIGELIEIENWVRGWGADCEVLEPQELRESMINHLRQQIQTYGLHAGPSSSASDKPDEPDADLFSNLFGG